MSKKNQKIDETSLDRSLDFEDFEMGFEPVGDDRQPKSKPGKSFAKGVKRGLTDTDNIKNIIKGNLPREYGKTLDMLNDVSSGARDFSESVIKDAKPVINDLANAADKFLPNNFKRTKEKLAQIRSWATDEEKNNGQSIDQRRDSSIGIELGRIFEQQSQVDEIKDKISRRDKALDRGLSMAQHKDILSVLIKVANNSTHLANYQTTINAAWQRKTLETQYRSLFILQDILEETKKSSAQVISSLAAITKNSALPDYRKAQTDEAFMEEARKRFSSKIIDASNSFFKKGFTKMKADVSASLGDLGNITSMVSMAGDMHSMEQEFDPQTLEEKLAGGAGGYMGKWLVSKAGRKIFDQIKKNPGAVKKILQGKNFLGAIQDDAAGLAKGYLEKGSEGQGAMAGILGYLNNSFEMGKQDTSLKHFDMKSMYNPTPFTSKVAHSITDVIPGYLARILQEQTTMRTGKAADLIKFDFRSGKFDTSKNIVAGVVKSISPDELSKNSSYYLDDVMSTIEDHVTLNDKERSEIAKILMKKGSSGEALTPSKMTNADNWADDTTTYDLAIKMATAMREVYGTESDKEFFSFDRDPNQKAKALTFNKNVRDLSNIKKDFSVQAQILIDSGLLDEAQKAKLIDDAGHLNVDLIDKNTTRVIGSSKGKGTPSKDITQEYTKSKSGMNGFEDGLIEKGYQRLKSRFVKTDKDGNTDGEGTSDVNVKEGIKKPDSVLDKLARLPMFNWRYKNGHGDNGATENLGPMAQDLNKEFGEDVAPTGKKVDLVNANGVAMKAIQELNSKVKGFLGGPGKKENGIKQETSSYVPQSGLEALRGIYYNTTMMSKQQGALINLNSEALKTLANGFGATLSKIDLSGAGKAAQTAYNESVKFVKNNSASSILGKIGDFISNSAGGLLGDTLSRGKKFLSKSMSFGKNTLSGARDAIVNTFDKSKLKALETFDVFVGNEKEPRMIHLKMKLGKYRDFNTQEVITTRSQIRAIEGSIVEVDDNGNQEIVLLQKELEATYFVNVYKNAIEKAVSGTFDFAKKNAKSLLNNIVNPSIGGLKRMATSAYDMFAKLVDGPIDIFVKGKPENPILLAKKMRAGLYTDFADGTVIERPSQIKGAVFDSSVNEMACSIEDFRTGLVDIKGNPISTSAGMKAAGLIVGAGASMMNYAFKKLSQAPGMLGKMASKGSKMLGSLVGSIPGISFGMFGQESVDVLKDIRAILKYQSGLGGTPDELKKAVGKTVSGIGKNLMGGATSIITGAGGAAANDSNPNQARPANDERSESNKGNAINLFGLASGAAGLASKAFNFFRKKKGSAETEQPTDEAANDSKGGNKSIFDKISAKISSGINKAKESNVAKKAIQLGADGKQYVNGLRKGSWQEKEANATNKNAAVEREKAKVRIYETKNIFTMISNAVGALKNKIFGNKDETNSLLTQIRNILGVQAGMEIPGGGKGGKGKAGKAAKGGSKLGKLARFGGKALGAAGVAYGAYSAYDNLKQGNYGEAALDAGMTAVGAGVTFGGVGATMGALGTIGGGILTAGAAIGSGALALVSSPIVLTGLAIAGAAYGGYKAYKYLTRKEFNTTEVMRMLEYGLRGADIEQQRTINELELYLETVSKTTADGWSMDEKKLDMKKVYDIFSIDPKERNKTDPFNVWFLKRFKPVFGKWKNIVKRVSGEDSINWLEKAKTDKLLEVYQLFRLSNEVYSITDSPWSNIKLNKDVSVITNFRDQWLMSLKNEAVKNKDEKTGKEIAATGATIIAGRDSGKTDDQTLDNTSKAGTTSLTNNDSTKDNVNKSNSALSVVSTADAGVMSMFSNNSISALMSVRYRSYGLTQMRMTNLIAIRNLEQAVQDFIKIDSSGKAIFDGDVTTIIDKAGGYFGVSLKDEFSKDWMMWFKNRFLPVYLNFHTGLFSVTKRAEVKSNLVYVDRLTGNQALIIARALMGTPGIWGVKEFAFKNITPNADPSSCDSNIQFLESQAKDEQAQEQKAAKIPEPTKQQAAVSDKIAIPENKPQQQTKMPVKATAAQAMGVSDEAEDKSYADKGGGGSKPKTISSGSVGSLVNAPGDLFAGSGAMQFLKLKDGADINGLHPSVKRLFLGMVEEFGQKTGKTVQVNRAYSSFEQQAALYKQYGPGRAARPGSSLHEYGLAIDVQSADLEQMDKLGLLRKYGFTRPLGSEPWHLEPAGIHDAKVRNRAKKDHQFATSFIEAGVGRGGGGLGSRGRKGELKRDDGYAKSIFNAGSTVAKEKDDTPSSGAAVLAKGMTDSASKGASSALAGGSSGGGGGAGGAGANPLVGKLPESEGKEGAVPSSAGAGSISTGSVGKSIKAANDDLVKTSKDLATEPKGATGSIDSLPDSTGPGWAGNSALITAAAKMVGVDPGLGAAIAAKESSLNPNARGKSKFGNDAEGLFQFMPGTWGDMMKKHGKKYGIKPNTSPMNAKANALLGLEYIKEGLSKGDGSAHEAYLGHMLGHGGLGRFRSMKDTDIPAKVLPSSAANNPYVFFHNGDTSKPRTKAEMIEYTNSALQKQLADFNIPLSIGNMQTVAKSNTEAVNDPVVNLASSGNPSSGMMKVGYTPTRSAPTENSSPSPVQEMAQAAPVRSTTRTAPVVENKNNGLGRIETISSDQLVEAKVTNTILSEIRDMLRETITSAKTQGQGAGQSSGAMPNAGNASKNLSLATKNEPVSLPKSLVQKRRA